MTKAEKNEKVLIVEDEVTLYTSMIRWLAQDGFRVEHADTGTKGWEMIQANHPNIVLLDINLPELDGTTILRWMRRDPTKPEAYIPVIMVTGSGMEGGIIAHLEAGADDYVVKPFAMGELLSRVRRILARGPLTERSEAHEISFANITVNVPGHRIFKDNKEINLRGNKAFDILVYLARNKNIVYSRRAILTAVWDNDFVGDERNVDVHIRWLRQAIEADPDNPRIIKTKANKGYYLEDKS